ncbi:hypothetical protein TeGR_g6531 [Tetraparma gracilis]|uniref:Uncharacterized protein n=1 Tax=Tetraparma gracilis TaxID=2962635 RepID=A0ABQ6M428_9STRA|nr:hypothetical protein TeGR_g6531 [Tetraparma gracilis]
MVHHVVCVDLLPSSLARFPSPSFLPELLAALHSYIVAFKLLEPEGTLLVFGASHGTVSLLSTAADHDGPTFTERAFQAVRDGVAVENARGPDTNHLAASLSVAMCRLNALRPAASTAVLAADDTFSKLLQTNKTQVAQHVQSVFLLSLSPDPVSPLPMLTIAFSALQHDITISTLSLPPTKETTDSLLLPQVTALTNGVTMPPPKPKAWSDGGLISILLTVFLPSPATLAANQPEFIDWVAREGGEEVSVGYVCGMCTNVTKAKVSRCQVCGKDVEFVNE